MRQIKAIKAPIAGNSKAIAKIGNAELVHFNKQMLIHELIRGSLVCREVQLQPAEKSFTAGALEFESDPIDSNRWLRRFRPGKVGVRPKISPTIFLLTQ